MLLSAAAIAWLTGTIGFAEKRPSRIAAFGNDLVVYEWELSGPAQSCYLRIDGKQAYSVGSSGSSDVEIVRLAVVDGADEVTFHLQRSGATITAKVSKPPGGLSDGGTRHWTAIGRHVEVEGPTTLLKWENVDAAYNPIKTVELVVE